MNWIHRLFNPHCPTCMEEDRIKLELEQERYHRDNECDSCKSLSSENAFLREQVRELQDHILHPSIPNEPIVADDTLKPVTNYRKPFSAIRKELEQADKLKAKVRDEQLIKEAAKPDINPITDDEGKVDPAKIIAELESMDKEIRNAN